MLHHKSTGPDAKGEYQVSYKTPGCEVPTVVCSGMRNRSAADREAQRRNDEQLAREKVLQADALARGLYTVHSDLVEQ